MKRKTDIARSLALITQLGISMLVPIFLCLAIGIWLDGIVDIGFTILFLILGFLAGGRNVWILAKHEGERQTRHTRKRTQYDLMAGWKKEEKDE